MIVVAIIININNNIAITSLLAKLVLRLRHVFLIMQYNKMKQNGIDG